MSECNKVTIAGLLIKKDRNADNIDIKRPVLDFEIALMSEDGSVFFENIPVVLSENSIARSSAGFFTGEIFLICGKLRGDAFPNLYIDAESLIKIGGSKHGKQNEIELLELSKKINTVVISGIVKEIKDGALIINTKRENYSRGDLETNDDIVVVTQKKYKIGTSVVCVGKMCSEYVEVDNICSINNKEE